MMSTSDIRRDRYGMIPFERRVPILFMLADCPVPTALLSVLLQELPSTTRSQTRWGQLKPCLKSITASSAFVISNNHVEKVLMIPPKRQSRTKTTIWRYISAGSVK